MTKMQNGFKGRMCRWSLSLLILTVLMYVIEANTDTEFLNEYAIRVKRGGREVAENIASDHGFRVTRELKHSGIYILEPSEHHRSKRSFLSIVKRLANDHRVDHAHQEEVLLRQKRSFGFYERSLPDKPSSVEVTDAELSKRAIGGKRFNDPEVDKMWYIKNDGQNGGDSTMDMNIGAVWKMGFTGKGVVATILDDGVDHRHPDLKKNYDPKASTDLNDKNDTDHDPLPNWHDDYNRHGTRCAGEVAATANNSICGVGIAYNCKIGGIRILDGKVTDSLETEALLFNNQYVDIYSASWGPLDNGKAMDGPRKLGSKAIEKAVKEGRRGLGSIFVWAAGNGGHVDDHCGADGYLSRPETVSIGSVNVWGKSPFFIENCTSTMAVVPSGGPGRGSGMGRHRTAVITTDMNFGCVENFQGTSSAAPLAVGCFATVLEANPKLGWRDLQHILVHSTRIPSGGDTWTINGAGLHVSPSFGFGMIDCGKMVQLAQNWTNFPERHKCPYAHKLDRIIPRNGNVSDSMEVDGCANNKSQVIDRLEHVEVYVHMDTVRRGETVLTLTSPAGTSSTLLDQRSLDKKKGEWGFTFMTVHSWDEHPRGKWTLTVKHLPVYKEREEKGAKTASEAKPFGKLIFWKLTLYGTGGTQGTKQVEVKEMGVAYHPSEEEILSIEKDEIERSKRLRDE